MGVQVVALSRTPRNGMAIQTSRTLDDFACFGEKRCPASRPITDGRKVRRWFELGARYRRHGCQPKSQAEVPCIHACPFSALSIGSVRIRLPVAAKMALVTAGAIAAVGRLADAAGRFGTLYQVRLDCRRLVDTHGPIVVEVPLLDPAVPRS